MFIYTLLSDPLLFSRYIVIIVISITLHELAHGIAAISQGDDTPARMGHMTPNPVVHMGWHAIILLCVAGIAWGQMPVNPHKFRHGNLSDIIVSAAGPLSNLAIAVVCITLIFFYDNSTLLSIQFLYLAAKINLTLFLLNMLPIPPLDGFNIFSNVFPILKPLGTPQIGMFALMVIFLIPGFTLALSQIADFAITIALGNRFAIGV